jgi:hypothetical protein
MDDPDDRFFSARTEIHQERIETFTLAPQRAEWIAYPWTPINPRNDLTLTFLSGSNESRPVHSKRDLDDPWYAVNLVELLAVLECLRITIGRLEASEQMIPTDNSEMFGVYRVGVLLH